MSAEDIDREDEKRLFESRGFRSVKGELDKGEPDIWTASEDTLVVYDSEGDPWVKPIEKPVKRGDLYIFGLKDEDKRDIDVDFSRFKRAA